MPCIICIVYAGNFPEGGFVVSKAVLIFLNFIVSIKPKQHEKIRSQPHASIF
jgi:hypothetical protein